MHIHILGIAGQGMVTPLAIELKHLGHTVTGSDQEKIYPPASTELDQANIAVNQLDINPKIDLAIIGSSFRSFPQTAKEFEKIIKQKIPYISATQYLAKNLTKPESIIVAGSFGKTTISSILAWILTQLEMNPSYLFGGKSTKTSFTSLHISDSTWSVLEGDEAINGLDTQAKFLYYPVKYLLLTSANWEHKEAYKNEIDNFNAFKKLVTKLPTNGLLIINLQGQHTKKLAAFSTARVVSYNGKDADYQIKKITSTKSKTVLHITTPQQNIQLKTSLIGSHNYENILGALSLCLELGFNQEQTIKAIESYSGIKRRLEVIPQKSHVVFIDDMAQSAPRISAALLAIKQHFPTKTIKVYFEPHATFLQYKAGLTGLRNAFLLAHEIVLGKINFKATISPDTRVTFKDFQVEIGTKLNYLPLIVDVYTHFKDTLSSDDVLVHFSSGGLDGMNTFHQIIKHFDKRE